MDQIAWSQEVKDLVWSEIVRLKIFTQLELLRKVNRSIGIVMQTARDNVQPGDPTNREAMAARHYFSCLFSFDFDRREDNPINSALNYGYSIITSEFSRIIALHGYHTALGIHHCKRDNRINFSCDLMEPFRPFVDFIVFQNQERELDWKYKKELIAFTQKKCVYGEKQMSIVQAAEEYTLNVLASLRTGNMRIKEIHFV